MPCDNFTDNLSPDNFIEEIKKMGARDRNKIPKEKLIDLIVKLAEAPYDINKLENRIVKLETNYLQLKSDVLNNTTSINKHSHDLRNLPTDSQVNINKIAELEEQLKHTNKQILNIEQYLRVNNVEIIGLPQPNAEETHEEVILKAINALPDLQYEINSDHIDISHPIPTRRKDEKTAAVCRFKSRKVKIDILEAAKKVC